MEPAICAYCGKKFMKIPGPQKFCGKKCYRASEAAAKRSARKKKDEWKPAGTEKEIIRINRLAREKGLSYGQYVLLYGGGADVRGKEVSTTG